MTFQRSNYSDLVFLYGVSGLISIFSILLIIRKWKTNRATAISLALGFSVWILAVVFLVLIVDRTLKKYDKDRPEREANIDTYGRTYKEIDRQKQYSNEINWDLVDESIKN